MGGAVAQQPTIAKHHLPTFLVPTVHLHAPTARMARAVSPVSPPVSPRGDQHLLLSMQGAGWDSPAPSESGGGPSEVVFSSHPITAMTVPVGRSLVVYRGLATFT